MSTYWRARTPITAGSLNELTNVFFNTDKQPTGILAYQDSKSDMQITSQNLVEREEIFNLGQLQYNGRTWKLTLEYDGFQGVGVIEFWANGTRLCETYIYNDILNNLPLLSGPTFNRTHQVEDNITYDPEGGDSGGKLSTAGVQIFLDSTTLVPGTNYEFRCTIRAGNKDPNGWIFCARGNASFCFYLEDCGNPLDTELPAPIVSGSLLSSDSFNRANSASDMGSTDGLGLLDPLAWQQAAGTWGINNNQAYLSAGIGFPLITVVDLGTPNVDMRINLAAIAASSPNTSGLVFRYKDNQNFWVVENNPNIEVVVSKVVANNATVVGIITMLQNGNASLQDGEILQVITSGKSIRINQGVNGPELFNIVDSFNSTQTKFGLYIDNDTSVRFDDWLVYAT